VRPRRVSAIVGGCCSHHQIVGVAVGGDSAVPKNDGPDHLADMVLGPVSKEDALRPTSTFWPQFSYIYKRERGL
jgi:hypothetical protein